MGKMQCLQEKFNRRILRDVRNTVRRPLKSRYESSPVRGKIGHYPPPERPASACSGSSAPARIRRREIGQI
jgi:hypothetical protein